MNEFVLIIFLVIFIIIPVIILLSNASRKNTKEGMYNYYGVWNVKFYKCDANNNVNVLYDQGVLDLKNRGSGSFVSRNGKKYDVELIPDQGGSIINGEGRPFDTSQAGSNRGMIDLGSCNNMLLEKA